MEPTFFKTGGGAAKRTRRGPSHRGRNQVIIACVVIAALAVGLWVVLHDSDRPAQRLAGETTSPAGPSNPPAGNGNTNTPPIGSQPPSEEQVAREGHVPTNPTPPQQVTGDTQRELTDKLAQAESLFAQKKLLEARALFNQIVDQGLGAEQNARCVARLTELADQTIFSFRHIPDDPTTALFKVPPLGVFDKIAKTHKVRAVLLQEINGIPDAKRLRAGQTIKVVNGPFNAVVDKSDFTLSVYLDVPDGEGRPATPLLVRRYGVGLGEFNLTPTGVWKVVDIAHNPPYNHPRTNEEIAPNSPEYPFAPLGLWIRLEGIYGKATGQIGYGIHSTNEPESIGKQASLGCIRVGDEGIQMLVKLLRIEDSRVTIRE